MDETPDPLWLHAYSGKENGLMVVGSPSAMRALGQQLVTAADDSTAVTERWPKEIASPSFVGPYRDVPDFQLSFHLKGTAPLDEIAPLRRRNVRAPVFLAVAACTIIGAVTAWRWFIAWAF